MFGLFGLSSSLHLVGSASTLLPPPPHADGTGTITSFLAGTLLPPLPHQLAPYCLTPLSAGTLLPPTLFRFPEDLYGYLLGATHPLRIGYSGGLGFSPLLFCSARDGQRSFFSFSASRWRLLVANRFGVLGPLWCSSPKVNGWDG